MFLRRVWAKSRAKYAKLDGVTENGKVLTKEREIGQRSVDLDKDGGAKRGERIEKIRGKSREI